MLHRPRRLRSSQAIRDLVRETQLSPTDFIAPLFVTGGHNQAEEIGSMPGYFRFSIDRLETEVMELSKLGCRAFLLFVKVEDHLKDNTGKAALDEDGLMQQSIRSIKSWVPEACLMTDVALDPYSSFGHDGLVEDGVILNDESVAVLAKMAVSHARAGADMVAPSDMMDGRIKAIRTALDTAGFSQCGIMAYSAKYASCFYGPFRDALDSAPGFGDKKTYQMDPSNASEAIREARLDEEEGADILMIKPALAYLDIIKSLSESTHLPVSAYHVSGEYAMIKAAAKQGWIEEESAVLEVLTAIKRAGARMIVTYFVKDILTYLKSQRNS